LPQIEYSPRKIVFLDENAGPDFFEEFLFANDVAGSFHQHNQRLNILRGDGNSQSLAQQDFFLGVMAILAEFINVLCFQATARRKKFSITSSGLLKDIPGSLSAPC